MVARILPLTANPESLDEVEAVRVVSVPQGPGTRAYPRRPRMNGRILITGSKGLVGRALRAALEARGNEVTGLDLLGSGNEEGDVREPQRVREAIAGCHGVVHLAAVSRVVWGEHDPDRCWSTNVDGLRNVLGVVEHRTPRPWLLFSSSREVYGQPRRLPATEDLPLQPVNVYGRSKVEGERLVDEARGRGLRAATVRLSNVYGSARDHADRVVPAFARAAISGDTIRIEGAECTFDFTHINDTVRGMVAIIDRLGNGQATPPIHLLTGVPTTLRDLAAMAMAVAGSKTEVIEAPLRSFDVSRFHGNPARAGTLLGWTPRIALRDGLERLVDDLRAQPGAREREEPRP